MKLCGFDVGLDRPLFLIAGPDTLESEQLCLDVAGKLKEHTAKLGMPYIFKGSFDKANRTSGKSYRGTGDGGRSQDSGVGEEAHRRSGAHRRARGHPAEARSPKWST